MKVTLCVDALAPNPGGIGRYTWELCKGLAKRDDVEARFFGRNVPISDPSMLLRGEIPRRLRGFRKLRGWWDIRAMRQGIVHGPNYFLPSFADGGVITVHDLSVFRHPETHPLERVREFERRFAANLERASHIITDTETVGDELITDFGISPDHVTAIHLGVGNRFKPQAADVLRQRLSWYGLRPQAYCLSVSTFEPRKKTSELVKTWRRLPLELRTQFPLVLAGGSGWLNDVLRAEIKQGEAEGWLRNLGFIAEADLPTVYAGAALFIYPSIYEGFGLPPLEAMACGVPTIVSSRSCMPEVCGDAAGYVNPEDPEQMLLAIVKALSDPSWRSQMSKQGIERASAFTWERCVDRTVAIYRQVGSSVR